MEIYAIRPDGVYNGTVEYPDSPTIPAGFTTTPPPAIPEGFYAVMQGGWVLVEGAIPPYPSYSEIQSANKSQAETLLKQTDWTATVDINNPQYSNPYLGNQDAFLSYRSQVRQIAVNPPTTPVTNWPAVPNEVWVDVPPVTT